MARISKADFEIIVVTCEHCGNECVYNRREDFINNIGPYAGEDVICRHCRREFRIMGDTINPTYELFIFAAREYFRGKRYMLGAASMGQAWELFFSTFAGGHYLYRPFFLSSAGRRDLDRLNSLQSKLDQVLHKYTFYPLRNLVVNSIVQAVAPQTLDEAALAIDRIASAEMGNNPSPSDISPVADLDTNHVLVGLLGLSIGELRNRVLHRRAYRPLRAEVERCLDDEVELLYRAKNVLGVRSFEELDAGLI